MNSRNTNLDAQTLWDDGVELSHAWFHFAPEEKQNLFRDAVSETAAHGIERRLKLELEMDLSNDQYFVVGFKRDPFLENEPEILPKVLLFSRPRIDWNDETIFGRGQTYDLVRVLARNDSEIEPDKEPTVPPAVLQSSSDTAVSNSPETISSNSKAEPLKKKGNSQLAHDVIAKFVSLNSNWLVISSEKKISEFNAAFFEMYPNLRDKTPPVTPRSLRTYQADYLARLRKVPESSGKQ